jgi:sec-independent protein translocase protein TatA
MELTGIQTAGLGGLGFQELFLILAVAVLLFGGKKIPEVAKGIGEGIRNFKTALKGDEETAELKKDDTKKDEEKVEAKR